MGIYALFYIYRCAKFGVAVFKASMLNWGLGDQSAMGICALFYIYRSAIRCAKFGIVVFKTSMLGWRRGGGESAIGICALCNIYLPVDLPSLA